VRVCETIRDGRKKEMNIDTKAVTALWLKTGKKLNVLTNGLSLTDKGAVVRSSDTGFLVVPNSSIVAIEVCGSSKDELDGMFNGQDTTKATA
jgi:hypothetical protein